MRINWTEKKIQEEALKYNSKLEFRLGSKTAYEWARKKKIVDLVCKHMTGGRFFWTEALLVVEALKYKTRAEFGRCSPAYQAAHHKGILDDICTHMRRDIIYWTNESLQIEALKYKTRLEFKKGSSGYDIAILRGILNQICSHMKPSVGTSLPERELLNTIKQKYSSAKSLMDRKVKINNKPYIKGFQIDIFIPELNKGIEFDGKYHHAFEQMRKDPKRSKWSDKDIRNYHNLKDSWFASKGIQILHIKEEDWNKDKEGCIKRCFEFLSA
jgi:very-short-patch-repair endonuclease